MELTTFLDPTTTMPSSTNVVKPKGVPAQAGLPLFAADLRQAPEWFRQLRQTRQIGCCYADDQAPAFLLNVPIVEAFDAVLFVEKTAAARKNPAR